MLLGATKRRILAELESERRAGLPRELVRPIGLLPDRGMKRMHEDKMDLKALQDTPPWEWPRDAAERFQKTLLDHQADQTDRLIAAELAGDLTVINDDLADALTRIIRSPDEPE